ncbi:MAG: RidA family protein [Chloroflexota bacterium]
MKRKIITTDQAPAAIGPYSQAIRVGKLVYTAGQVALDPATGQLVEGDVAAQTERVLRNLQAVLEAAETSLTRVIKTTVFLQNMDDFAAMNAVYSQFFSEEPPARSTVAVAALPKGALVEIEAVALIKK